MKQSKYFIEGVQAAQAGMIRVCRYKQPENVTEFFSGYDSICRDYQVIRFTSNPRGKSLKAYRDNADVVFVGSLAQCEDKRLTLSQAERSAFFAVYSADGHVYRYKSFNEELNNH